MQAVILHAEGDERLAADVAAKIAPADATCARLKGASGLYGEQFVLFAIWSARADAAALGQTLSRVAARSEGRCVVVRADGTPLPPLPAGARLITIMAPTAEFAAELGGGRASSASAAIRRSGARAVIGGWTPGVSIGLAIYAGMFVMAGAWRSEEVTEAIETGKAVPLASALHSFQTAAVAGVDRIQVALAPESVPTASFRPPQRVILTGALDTSSRLPVVAEAPSLRMMVGETERTPAPIRLHPIEASLQSYAQGDTSVSAGALSLELHDTLPSFDARGAEY